jgi:hypothetical protein
MNSGDEVAISRANVTMGTHKGGGAEGAPAPLDE